MSETRTEERLGKLETEFAIVKNDVTAIGRSLSEFREDWSKKAEDDRTAHRNARLTLPQVVAMVGTAVVVTGAFLGGLLYLVNGQVATAKTDLAAQIQATRQSGEANTAQVGLSVRGQGDSVTALNTAYQAMQREQAADRVKLGLVEQVAAANAKFIEQAQGFDAQMARHEERQRAFADALRAQETLIRELASRRSP
jgi:hypothetical protein